MEGEVKEMKRMEKKEIKACSRSQTNKGAFIEYMLICQL